MYMYVYKHEEFILVQNKCYCSEGSFCFASIVKDWNAVGVSVLQHLLGPLAAPDIVPGGLLHDTPPAYAKVLELVQECSEPMNSSGRFRAAQDLTALLAKVLRQHSFSVWSSPWRISYTGGHVKLNNMLVQVEDVRGRKSALLNSVEMFKQKVIANKHNSHPCKIRDATEMIQTTKRPWRENMASYSAVP